MTITQAQIRKDARLNIAYEDGVRQAAPLGKIGNLTMTSVGSPKARMPGLFERFAIFWKAVFRARIIARSSDFAMQENFNADKHRVQKYTSELLGKLQLSFVEARTESDHGKALSSIRKTLGKLHRTIISSPTEPEKENLISHFKDAVRAALENRADVSVMRSGLEYLIFERKSAMVKLPEEERKMLHEIALDVGVDDIEMEGVLYFRKERNCYNYSEHYDDNNQNDNHVIHTRVNHDAVSRVVSQWMNGDKSEGSPQLPPKVNKRDDESQAGN